MNDLANAPLTAPEIPAPSNEGDSLRDTLAKAIETARVETPADTGAPKPAAPANDRPVDRPLDTKPGEQPRGPDGKFAPAAPQQANPAAPVAAPKPGEQAPAAAHAPVPAAQGFKAPVGWNAAAKAQFDALPAEVREAVAKREEEVNRGFEVLQRYKGLDEFQPYIDRAQTTHAEVMRRAVEWERSLQTRPLDTIRHVVNLTGLDPRLIAHALVNPGAQLPQQQQPTPQQPIDIAAEVDKALKQRETMSSVESFMADPKNEHVETVAPQMALLIQHARSTGQPITLEEAYQRAIWADPQIRETLINQRTAPPPPSNGERAQQAANQARQAAKAITGAPSGGRAPPPGPQSAETVRDAIIAGINAQR